MGDSVPQEGGDITRTLCDGDNLHRRANGAIHDNVSAYRKKQHRVVRKVFALVTDAW